MNRTNIFLEERQTVALDELARSQGSSRAEVIRRILDRALANEDGGAAAYAAAIEYSFNALQGEDMAFDSSPSERSAHLETMWNR